MKRFLKARYILPALAATLLAVCTYRSRPRVRADRYLASSGLAPIPETAREFALTDYESMFCVSASMDFFDTNENIRRWLSAAPKPPRVSQLRARQGSRGPDYAMLNDYGCETVVRAGDGDYGPDQFVRVEVELECPVDGSELKSNFESFAEFGTWFWALDGGRILRLACDAHCMVALTSDGGLSWEPPALNAETITAAAGRGDWLWIAAEDRIYISRDRGRSFVTVSSQLGAIAHSPAVRAAFHASAVWQLVPAGADNVYLLTNRRVLELDHNLVLRERWHLPADIEKGSLLTLHPRPSGAATLTFGPPARLLFAPASGGELAPDRSAIEPTPADDGRYRYLRIEDVELVLAGWSDHPGCRLLRRVLGATEWSHVTPLELGRGGAPAVLSGFADQSGRFLIGCGAEELLIGDRELHFERLTLPAVRHWSFTEPAAVGEEIWFGLSGQESAHRGIAVRSDGTHRFLD